MNRSSFPSSKRSAKARPVNRWSYREDDDDDDEEDEVELPESSEDEDNDNDYGGYQRAVESNHRNRTAKKRKVDEVFNSSYEFRPRGTHMASHPQWDDHSTCALLDAWGERFLQLGRSSLRSDDWSEVAERVSEVTGYELGVSDCRNRLNSLKNKYRKEKAKTEDLGGGSSKWNYFKKMDMLMTMPPRQQQQCGLACGVDSGEFVFMNPRVYLDHSNALDEMRDSPDVSEEEDDEEEEDERRGRRRDGGDEAEDLESYRMLSESIKRVGEIYENIESSKRHHMMELDRMRMEFQRDLEMQKKEMVERTRVEIERMQQAEDEDIEDGDGDGDGDGSAQTASE